MLGKSLTCFENLFWVRFERFEIRNKEKCENHLLNEMKIQAENGNINWNTYIFFLCLKQYSRRFCIYFVYTKQILETSSKFSCKFYQGKTFIKPKIYIFIIFLSSILCFFYFNVDNFFFCIIQLWVNLSTFFREIRN